MTNMILSRQSNYRDYDELHLGYYCCHLSEEFRHLLAKYKPFLTLIKLQTLSFHDKLLSKSHSIIKTINYQLKMISQNEEVIHCCVDNCSVHLVSGLITCCSRRCKSSIRLDPKYRGYRYSQTSPAQQRYANATTLPEVKDILSAMVDKHHIFRWIQTKSKCLAASNFL